MARTDSAPATDREPVTSRSGLRTRLLTHLPILQWLPTYRRSRLTGDLLAGLVVAALAIPQSLGYAGIAGVPVQVGLYAIPAALIAYAVLGTSRLLFLGPVSTVSVLSGSLVAGMGIGGDPQRAVLLTSALAVATGGWLIVAGALRLGWSAEFLSKPIITGFVFGLVILIIIGELPNLLGLPPERGDVLARITQLVTHLSDLDPLTAAIGLTSLTVLFLGARFLPRVPWAFVVLVLAIAASAAFDLAGQGVATVGEVPLGLPPLTVPTIGAGDVVAVIFGGAALAMVGLGEGLSAARIFSTRQATPIDANQEFLAAGVANVGAGLSGGLAVAGSLSKTAAAERAGARTQVYGLSAAVIVVLVLLVAATLLDGLPRTVLSAIVIQAVWGLLDVRAIRRFRRVRRNDFVSCLAAAGGVLVFGPLYGLLAAIGQSVLGVVYRSSRVDVDVMGRVPGEKAAWGSVDRHPERRTIPGIVVLRLDAPLFWANATEIHDRILAAVDERPETSVLLLDLEASNQLDTTSVDVLFALLDHLDERGIALYLVRVLRPVRQVLRRSGFFDRLPDGRVWHSISQGVREARVEHDVTAASQPEALVGPGAQAEDEEPTTEERIAVEHGADSDAEDGDEADLAWPGAGDDAAGPQRHWWSRRR